MMMGTADEIVKAPEKGPIFAEDMPEEEQAVAVVSPFVLPQLQRNSTKEYRRGLALFKITHRYLGLVKAFSI